MRMPSIISILSSVVTVAICLVSWGCAKPYIGRTLPYYNEYWCTFDELPAECKVGGEGSDFAFRYTVNRKANAYVIEGDALWQGATGMIMIKEISAAFILANERVVTDYIPFGIFPRSLRDPIHFKKTFQTADFDAVYITYSGTVHD